MGESASLLSAIVLVLIGAIMAAKLGDEGGIGGAYALALLLLIGVYSTGFGWSWGPLSWLVPSEIFPLEVRSAGQSVTVASGFVFTILVAQFFLAMLCRMKAGIFFFFAGWIAAMTAFVYLFLPETKRIPIEQIDKVWGEHWFWRRVIGVDSVEEAQATEKLNNTINTEVLISAIMAVKLGEEGELSRAYVLALLLLIGIYSTGFGWSWAR
ncbi:hypothetical protein U9M48_002016 [Paspalum notatum var. saurae]|uniref:Major facilitator superfamily (MFS) profile domain-containing protein n=1 Tax=Paspalum notatum var. saurae TaxID=547442 RepID=A0AAQ3SJF4_PASNO